MSQTIRFDCPACGRPLDCDAKTAGMAFECSKCRFRSTVPKVSERRSRKQSPIAWALLFVLVIFPTIFLLMPTLFRGENAQPAISSKIGDVKRANSVSGGEYAHCFMSPSAYEAFRADKGDSKHLLNGNAWWVMNDYRVEIVEMDPAKQLVKVKIIDGRHAGKSGWMHEAELK